jgi:archaellum component FlaC
MAEQINITLNAIDNTKKALTDLQNNLRGIDKQTKEVTTSFFTFSNVLKTFITAEVIRGTFSILSAFQDMKVALNQVTGSAQQGGRAFDFLNKFSETSRFNIKDLSNAFILLYRSGINPSEELLKTFTDTASATRQPLETLNALILLFTKGTEGGMGLLQFKRLENEGIPVFKILREQFGLSKDAVEEYLKSITGTKYVLGLLKEGLGSTFGGTEAANAKNLSTTFDDVKNAGEKLIASLGDSGLNKVLAETFILLKDIIDLIKNSDFVKFLGLVGTGLGYVSDAIGKGVKAYKEARKGYQEAIGMGGKPVVKPDSPTTPAPNTLIQEVYSQLETASNQFKTQWTDINEIIAKGTVNAIKSVSMGIAESLVLGKKLQDTFKEIAQKILIKIIASLVEEQILKIALLALDQFAVLIGLQKLGVEKQITEQKQKQAEIDGRTTGTSTPEDMVKKQLGNIFDELYNKLKTSFDDIFTSISDIFGSISDYSSQIFSDIGSSLMDILGNLGSSVGDIFNSIGGSLGDILGSVGNMFGGGGGDGGFDMGTLFDIGMMIFGAAEGGALNAGQPYMVGERGRELFIPNQSGTMIPNHDLGTTGSTSINFTINATDVRGVQELLINNRATITNLVNQALNARGKSNLV